MTSSGFQPDTPGTDTDSPSDASPAVEPAEWVSHALEVLTPKQRLVIKLYWGLKDGKEYSFRAIGSLLGVTPMAVWNTYHAALARLEKLPQPYTNQGEGEDERLERNYGRKAKQLSETDRDRWLWLK